MKCLGNYFSLVLQKQTKQQNKSFPLCIYIIQISIRCLTFKSIKYMCTKYKYKRIKIIKVVSAMSQMSNNGP